MLLAAHRQILNVLTSRPYTFLIFAV